MTNPTRQQALRLANPEQFLDSGKAPSSSGAPVSPAPTAPDPPAWLKKHARAMNEWRELVPSLAAAGILADDRDVMLLAQLCYAAGTFVRLTVEIHSEGFTFETTGGKWPNPKLATAQQLYARLERLGRHFGLSPASRAQLRIEQGGDDESSVFVKGATR